jgi:hypothetical protein
MQIRYSSLKCVHESVPECATIKYAKNLLGEGATMITRVLCVSHIHDIICDFTATLFERGYYDFI